MRRTFNHLTYGQRVKIRELLESGCKRTDVAAQLGVHNATIYREIIRGTVNGEYNPDYAEERHQALWKNKGSAPIVSGDTELACAIAKLILEDKLSISQVLERLQTEGAFKVFPQSRITLYRAIDKGLIPGVTRDSLKPDTTTVFHDGQIHIAKWARETLDIHDGDTLSFEIDNGKIIFSKTAES